MPETKLKLLCSEEKPEKRCGLSLIDPAERLQALQLMANVRQLLVAQRGG
jgi:hypothetical protein